MHSKIGALEKGQEAFLQALAGYRAESLTRMDRIESLIKEQKPTDAQKGEVSLTVREMVIIAVALVIAGGFLGRVAPQLLSM